MSKLIKICKNKIHGLDYITATYPKGSRIESRSVHMSMYKHRPDLFLRFIRSLLKTQLKEARKV